MEPSVLSVGCRVLLAACKQLGLDTDALVTEAGIDRAALEDPDGRLPPEAAFCLWDLAYRASGDDHLALRVAQAAPTGAYRALEYVVASAPTVGAAFGKISQYFAWIDTSVQLPIEEHAESFSLGIDVGMPADRVPLRAAEYTFGTSWLKVREATGQPITPLRLEVGAPAPSTRGVVERFFGCPAKFGTEHNRIHFSREAWRGVSRNADAALLAVLERHAQTLVDSVEGSDGLAKQVLQLLEESHATLGLADVARKLSVSERTLQRRLADEGRPYVELVALAKKTLAEKLLSERKVAIAEVAFVLGFSDQSSFTRAFRRWTGQTPAAFREHAVAFG